MERNEFKEAVGNLLGVVGLTHTGGGIMCISLEAPEGRSYYIGDEDKWGFDLNLPEGFVGGGYFKDVPEGASVEEVVAAVKLALFNDDGTVRTEPNLDHCEDYY